MIPDGFAISGIGTPRASRRGMNVLLSTDGDRISPVLDAAKTFLLVSARSDGAESRRQLQIAEADPIAKAKRIIELEAGVLICGAISWPLEAMLASSGMRVIANTCGPLDEVLAAHFSGALTAQAFLMPGCPDRQHRHRHRHGRGWRNRW
jgi:predicted Fe-Mo cluster-binding NifX family protein